MATKDVSKKLPVNKHPVLGFFWWWVIAFWLWNIFIIYFFLMKTHLQKNTKDGESFPSRSRSNQLKEV